MKDIVMYEGLYAITPEGKVWSYPKRWHNRRGAKLGHNGKYLVVQTLKTGYRAVMLSKQKRTKGFTIHRLVAQAFIPNPENLPVINHKDGNKLNNSISNLEWCTHAQNSRHALITGLVIPHKAKHNSKCACFRCTPEHRGLGFMERYISKQKGDS